MSLNVLAYSGSSGTGIDANFVLDSPIGTLGESGTIDVGLVQTDYPSGQYTNGDLLVQLGIFFETITTPIITPIFESKTCGVVGLLPLVLIALLIFFAVISFINIRDGDLQTGLIMLAIAGILLLIVFVFYGALYNIICI